MKTYQIVDLLNSMTRSQLRNVARKLNIRTGRNKENTIVNIHNAIANGNARFTVEFTIREPGIAGSTFANAVFQKKLRTHKADKVIISA